MQTKSRVKEGSAEAHGALWDGEGTNFTLFSANATKVEVCLFDSAGDCLNALPCFATGDAYGATGRSLLLFALRTDEAA
jgi:pullulanase/glycogen debranching enzyme